jgi:hypothetical protein
VELLSESVGNWYWIADEIQSGEKGGNGSRGVIDASTIEHLATGVLELKLRIMFVRITADGNCLHDIPPRGAQSPTSHSSAQGGAVILSNRWSSRLGGRLSPEVPARKEPWSLVVVGGAAQLYVMHGKMFGRWARFTRSSA